MKRGAQLAGPGVRRGVQCGVARRHNKSPLLRSNQGNALGVTSGWFPESSDVLPRDKQLFHSAAAGGCICWESTVLSGWIFCGRSLGRADGLNLSRIAWKAT